MIIIIAEINRIPFYSGIILSLLKDLCFSNDILPPVLVQSGEALTEILEANRDEEILLLSNFPPDNSYSDVQSAKHTYRQGIQGLTGLEEISYAKSTSFFSGLCTKYSFKAIHFITGASEKQVSDEMLSSFSCRFPIQVTRKKDLPGLRHEQLSLFVMPFSNNKA